MEQPRNYFVKHVALFCVIIACIIVVIAGMIATETSAPNNAASNIIVPIKSGSTLASVAGQLYADRVIRSPFFFKVAFNLLQGKNHIGIGDYIFTKPTNAWTVAERLIHGEQDLPTIRVTLPEGLTAGQMAVILNLALASSSSPFFAISQFNQLQFLSLASTSEGYLFPDTYLFSPNDSASTVISVLQKNFNKKIATIQSDINAFLASSTSGGFNVTQNDIVIMASIVEKEATSTSDRRIIAGVLWKRIESGRPLQVDPPLVYANLLAGEKLSVASTLTASELESPSPYNTYKHKGLPPTPIDNPSLDALIDTITPTPTDYWFYLSDLKGNMHYSITYAGQLANQAKYLGN